MPEMGGLEATQIIRTGEIPITIDNQTSSPTLANNATTTTTPPQQTTKLLTSQPYIIAVTANAFEEDKQKCIHVGMNEVITKPINRQRLEAILKKATFYISRLHPNSTSLDNFAVH